MRLSAITTVLITAGVMVGCASNKPFAGMQVVPHTSTQHGATTAAGYYALARYFHGSSRLAEAERAYGDALRLEPAHVEALAGLGMVRSEQGRHVEAIALLKSAATRAPRSASILNNLGYALMASGEANKAVVELDKALAAAPGNTRIRNNLKLAHEAVNKARASTRPATAPLSVESTGGRDAPAPVNHAGKPAGQVPVASQEPAVPTLMAASPLPLAVSPIATELQTKVVELSPAVYAVEYRVPASGAMTASAQDRGWAQAAGATPLPVPLPATSIRPLAAELKSTVMMKSAVAEPKTETSGVCREIGPHTEGRTRLEVQNGNGTAGMAKEVGYRLASATMQLVRLTNRVPFDAPRTIVEYSKGRLSHACALAARFSLEAPRENPNLAANVDVRLVLGRDAPQTSALLGRLRNELALLPDDTGSAKY